MIMDPVRSAIYFLFITLGICTFSENNVSAQGSSLKHSKFAGPTLNFLFW